MTYDNLQGLVDDYVLEYAVNSYTESFEIIGELVDHLIDKFPLIYNQYEGRRDDSKYDLFSDEIEVEIESESFSPGNEGYNTTVYLSDEIQDHYIKQYPEYLI